MKRCALIISDDPDFTDWVGWHISSYWPKIMIERTKLAKAAMYLDSAPLERYHLIVVRLSFKSYADIVTGIFLIRILNLESHPEIVLITEHAKELNAAKSTKLGRACCLLASQLTSATMHAVLEKIAHCDPNEMAITSDGCPKIPGYSIQHPIAGTYTATIYRAFSKKLCKDVALKINEVKEPVYGVYHQLSLRQEYEILRKLGGEYVAEAYDYGEVDGLAYLALEYFPRGSIDRVIAKAGRKISRLAYMLQVAKALRMIHKAGFLHLDLKPNNVMIRANGTPALIDFGISKRIVVARYQESASFSMGSPYFMSPEQARGEPLDERSDIFSFGALWYRIFTGRTPFREKSMHEIILAAHTHKKVSPPVMDDALCRYQPIVDGTLVSSPDQRFPNAQVLVEKIESFTNGASELHRLNWVNSHYEWDMRASPRRPTPQPEVTS